jgi:festuclavine dehydrogenase
MAILLTGGTGKTSVRVARLLQDTNIPFLLASRRGVTGAPSGMPAINFDWLDPSTFERPFQYRFPGGETISTVYVMSPTVEDPETSMNAFVDYAVKEHGVKRFVLVAGSSAEPGKPGVGKVWQHFLDLGIEYCVLRPTWFMGASLTGLCSKMSLG